MKRIPSFNDFSPGIIGDLRIPLQIVEVHKPDFDKIVNEWASAFFEGADNKRARTNVSATLSNIGLFDRKTVQLTEIGQKIMRQPSAEEAAKIFCKHIIENMNGSSIIGAVRYLNARTEKVSKDSLKKELETLGITNLATATTDHTTLLNWMMAAGIVESKDKNFMPIDGTLKALLGVSDHELSEIDSLTTSQKIFLTAFRRIAEMHPAEPIAAKRIIDECLRNYPSFFDEDQLRKKILGPLEEGEWVKSGDLSGGRGAKSGTILATEKLLQIPITYIYPDFNEIIPADLRSTINLPLSKIQEFLNSSEKYERGLGLELLSLRIIMDLGLEPRAFRLRSKDTAYAEVDLTAEGRNLLFSRWNFQCKHITGKVALSDVAKEVGLAVYSKAHVVAVVTTSDFSRDAYEYAKNIALETHLQFLFIKGDIIKEYLKNGPQVLISYVLENAGRVMQEKRAQPIIQNNPDN